MRGIVKPFVLQYHTFNCLFRVVSFRFFSRLEKGSVFVLSAFSLSISQKRNCQHVQTLKTQPHARDSKVFYLCAEVSKGPITWGGLARLAGLARFAGISARLRNTLKINFAITWKNLSPASWDPGIAMAGSRLTGMKISHVIAIAGPVRLAGPTLFRP